MDKSFALGVVSLVRSAITGEKAVVPQDFDFEKLFDLARKHRVITLIYYGITNSEITLPTELNQKFFVAVCNYIALGKKQKLELFKLLDEFEENKIDHMLLKGLGICSLYPKDDMRPMGDADVLIHFEQYEKITPILEKHGLTFVKENLNELSWDKYPLYLELHRYLVSPQHKDYFKIFGNGWKYARLQEGFSHRYGMIDEDFYVFLFAHMTKHYRSSGVGIKHITDVWVYLNAKPNLNMEYVNAQLKKLKLEQFHKNVLKTVDAWFADGEFDEVSYLITERILKSGAFGTTEALKKANAVKEIQNTGTKNLRLRRIVNTIFLPYKNMCVIFPVLKKAPVLLPVMWVWRGVNSVFFKKGTIAGNFNAIKELSPELISRYEEELNMVGLDFKFEE